VLHPHQWSGLPQTWIHLPLPGIRESPVRSTYETFPGSELPDIPIELDDHCDWLLKYGAPHQKYGLDHHEYFLKPARFLELAKESNLQLPDSFVRFITSDELQKRVRSATGCYLDPGERVVKTVGDLPGHLIHFLSDSQSCVHWYLHVASDGAAAVLWSPDLYCYRIDDPDLLDNPSCGLDEIELQGPDFSFCAKSFPEFLYRFWIENEIWFALVPKENHRPLTELERNYVEHYTRWPRGR
jgi:hypothetical protein